MTLEKTTAAFSHETLATPALLLDESRMRRNIARMRDHLKRAGTSLRLHCKTCKCVEAALICQGGADAPVAVSTLAEAELFAAAGFTDILYAVGIAPQKLGRILALRQKGAGLKVILDNVETARALAAFGAAHAHSLDILLEIDCDGHRAGLPPDSPMLAEIGRELARAGQNVAGVITHAGSAYDLAQPTPHALRKLAGQETQSARQAAAALRAAGFACPIVSAGSTPTAHFGGDFAGITEVRAGVFIFQDCVMAALGVCEPADIALSVRCAVIGRRQRDGAIIVDAGWTALSQDRGFDFARFGYGLVTDMRGNVMPGLKVAELNQEHGVITGPAPSLRPGDILRILPAHACAAANAFSQYHVLNAEGAIAARWQKCRGW